MQIDRMQRRQFRDQWKCLSQLWLIRHAVHPKARLITPSAGLFLWLRTRYR